MGLLCMYPVSERRVQSTEYPDRGGDEIAITGVEIPGSCGLHRDSRKYVMSRLYVESGNFDR